MQTHRPSPPTTFLLRFPELRLAFSLGGGLGKGKACPERGCSSGVQPGTPQDPRAGHPQDVAAPQDRGQLTPGCWGALEHPELWAPGTKTQSPRSPKAPEHPEASQTWSPGAAENNPPSPTPPVSPALAVRSSPSFPSTSVPSSPSFPSTSCAQFSQHWPSPFPSSPQYPLSPVLPFFPVSHASCAQSVTPPSSEHQLSPVSPIPVSRTSCFPFSHFPAPAIPSPPPASAQPFFQYPQFPSRAIPSPPSYRPVWKQGALPPSKRCRDLGSS